MISYRIFTNNGIPGAPVDYSTVVVDTAALTCDLPPVGANAELIAVVQPYDTVTGYQDLSTDARVNVLFDGSGNDISGYPSAPFGLSARAMVGGSVRLNWGYHPVGGAIGFHVYQGVGTPDYSTPAAVVAFPSGAPLSLLSATLNGLTDGVAYTFAVRAFNASGEEINTATVTVTATATGPAPAIALSASVTP